MTSTVQYVFLALGMIVTVSGIFIYVYFQTRRHKIAEKESQDGKHVESIPGGPETKIEAGKFSISTHASSLTIIIIGFALMIAPFTVFDEDLIETEDGGNEFSFASEYSGDVSDEGPDTYSSFTTIYDDTNCIQVKVPVEWSDTLGTTWVSGDGMIEYGPAVSASADLDNYMNTWTEPGIFFGASGILTETETVDSLLDSTSYSDYCVYDGREVYSDSAYTGKYDFYSNCGGQGSFGIILSAVPPDESFIIFIQIQIVTMADLDALDQILASFYVLDSFYDTWGS